MTDPVPTKNRLERLHAALDSAANSFHNDRDESPENQPNREGSALAVTAVINYLRDMKFERRLIEPLRAILAAFADVDDGTSNSLFIPQSSEGGAPPLAHRRAADLGMASAIVSLLMTREHGEEEAAVRVVSVLNACGTTVAKRQDVSETSALINWRKTLKAGKKGATARKVYDGFCSPPQYENLSADELLQRLRQALSPESS